MQNLGPAQVETLYRNTRKGDSLCDLVTAELLDVTTMVKGMIGCENSQNPWLTAGSLILVQKERFRAARSQSLWWQRKHLDPPNLPQERMGFPLGHSPCCWLECRLVCKMTSYPVP